MQTILTSRWLDYNRQSSRIHQRLRESRV